MTESRAPYVFWAKFDEETEDKLSLLHHSADVAACAEAILRHTLLGKKLATLAGWQTLEPGHIARLSFLAALHDLGKTGVRFQRKILPGATERAGHVKEALELLALDEGACPPTQRFYELLPPEDFAPWGEAGTSLWLLAATICHHGRPYPLQGLCDPKTKDWDPRCGIDPLQGIAELTQAARGWFPQAFIPGPAPFPEVAALQHAWNGVLNLADWLGSSTIFFPYPDAARNTDAIAYSRQRAKLALRAIGLDTRSARSFLGTQPATFQQVSDKDNPRDAQSKLAQLELTPGGSVSVLEASTGVGKTEAALWRFARLFQAGEVDGLYFALPTRTAATQIYGRVRKTVERLFAKLGEERPPVVLAVPGYLKVDGAEGERLPGFEVRWDDKEPAFQQRAWAGAQSKRYLAGAVVVGTVDQVLLSALAVPHSHLRASALLRHFLVVDEVHASDAYMTRILEEVLTHHRAAGGHALLLSATLGASARHGLVTGRPTGPSLEQALATPYPVIHHRAWGGDAELAVIPVEPGATKRVQVELAGLNDNPAAIAQRALEAAQAGARVLVVRNQVADCVAVQEEVEAQARAAGREDLLFGVDVDSTRVPAPHHSRFASEDRKLLDGAIEHAFRPDKTRSGGRVAVATQTVEQSLDLDADLLITDLCPMDVLLQRIGRLHRHELPRPPGFEAARVAVLTPASRDLGELLKKNGEPQGAHGLGNVYEDLRVLEATWRQLESRSHLEIPRDCRALVEAATHRESLDAIQESGDDHWQQHTHHIQGRHFAERGTGGLNVLRWDKTFGEHGLSDAAHTIQTRLGERDLLLQIPGAPLGPFGKPIPHLALRSYELGEITEWDSEPTAQEVITEEGGELSFSFNGKVFNYGKIGLRSCS